MREKIEAFFSDEAGAVASDWAVIAGLICGVVFAVFSLLGGGSVEHVNSVEATFVARGIPTY